jgi:hypothetical protein
MSVFQLSFYPGPFDDPEEDFKFSNRVHIETAPGLASLIGSVLGDWSRYCVVIRGTDVWKFMSLWKARRFDKVMHTIQVYHFVKGPLPGMEGGYFFLLVSPDQKHLEKWLPTFWAPMQSTSLYVVDRENLQSLFEPANLRASDEQLQRILKIVPAAFFQNAHGAEVVVTVRGETFRRRLVKALKGVKRRKLNK